MILLDTSALVFWTLDRERLSSTAAQAISDSDRIVVSSISIWEIGIKSRKNRLRLPLSLREFANGLSRVDRVELFAVDTPTWVESLELDWDHNDPADRVIVATATLHGCPLVTSDTRIRSYYAQSVW